MTTEITSAPSTKVRFCFECGKKLRGKFAYQMEWKGHTRIFHKCCAKYLLMCETERRGIECRMK